MIQRWVVYVCLLQDALSLVHVVLVFVVGQDCIAMHFSVCLFDSYYTTLFLFTGSYA